MAFGLFGKNKFMPPNIAFMELFKFCKELSSVFNATEGPPMSSGRVFTRPVISKMI